MVGESGAMLRMQRMIAKVARRSSAVLITGESGTGKELVAREIHNASHRTPFVPVDCGSLPASLVESELFGYVQGAFTGAVRAKSGLFQAANGGTLFLDEVGELPRELQPKLLRALQQREVRPIGATRGTAVDVRVIAATHRDLREEVAAKRFREDLYFRLAVITLSVAPLRERREDIRLLAEHFAQRSGRPGFDSTIVPEAMELLLRYDWPGNVRELGNAIERAVTLNTTGPIRPEDLPSSVQGAVMIMPADPRRTLSLAEMERHAIEHALARSRNNKLEAARLLGYRKDHAVSQVEGLRAPQHGQLPGLSAAHIGERCTRALDHLCHSSDPLASGLGISRCRKPDPHPAGDRGHRADRELGDGPPCSLTSNRARWWQHWIAVRAARIPATSAQTAKGRSPGILRRREST